MDLKIRKTIKNAVHRGIYCSNIMKKETKLYFLISSMATGGAERQVSYLQNYFSSSIILCLEKEETNYDIDNARIIYINDNKRLSRFQKSVSFFSNVYKLYKLLRTEKDKITIVSFMEYSNFICYIISLLLPIRTILSVRNTISKHYSIGGYIFRFIHKLAIAVYRRATIIVVNSEGSQEDLMLFGVKKEQISVIHNMYDTTDIIVKANKPLSEGNNDIFNYPSILCVGRLCEQKGHRHLISVFSIIKREIKDVKLVLLGEGELKKELIELSIDLNLSVFESNKDIMNNTYDVYFMGIVKNPYSYYSKCTIFVLPSLYEGLPNVLIEAGICGAACISANCLSGPSELFLDKVVNKIHSPMYTSNGILMPVFDQCSNNSLYYTIWANTISSLIQNTPLRLEMAENLRTKTQQYSIELIAKEWNKKIIEEYTTPQK